MEWKQPGAPTDRAEYELYDYERDPLETRNLAKELPDVVDSHRKILAGYPEAATRGQKPRKTPTPRK